MEEYLCTKTLKAGTGEVVFIKGKTYKGQPFIHSDPIGIELLDEQGEQHAVTKDQPNGEGWQRYFKEA